jgi:molecular chaperone DnaK
LVGGSTRMPMIKQLVGETSGKTPSEELNPDECVAQGAAWQALLLAAKQGDLPREIERLLPPNLTVQKVTSHNMGEVAIRNTDGKERVFLMIPKFTPVPFEHTETFSTIQNNQTGVHMRAMECGDMDPDNTCDPLSATEIGDATIANLPPSPAGSPVSITYRFNENGTLEVSGTHVVSGRRATATIKRPGALSDADMSSAMANMKRMTVSG